jgi:hypothetical protein
MPLIGELYPHPVNEKQKYKACGPDFNVLRTTQQSDILPTSHLDAQEVIMIDFPSRWPASHVARSLYRSLVK